LAFSIVTTPIGSVVNGTTIDSPGCSLIKRHCYVVFEETNLAERPIAVLVPISAITIDHFGHQAVECHMRVELSLELFVLFL